MLRRRITLAAKLAVAGGLITWLLASGKINFSELKVVGERWPWFLAAQVPFGIIMLLAAYRWRLLLRAQGIEYNLKDAFSLTMIGQLFNQLVIGTTGGDMVKAYIVAVEHPKKRGPGILSVFVDRVVGLLVLVVVAFGGILVNLDLVLSRPGLISSAVLVAVTLVASLLGGYVFYSERVRSLALVRWCFARLPFRTVLRKVSAAIYVYKFHPREVRRSIASSLVIHACSIAMNLALANALIREPFAWQSFLFLIPLAQIAMAVPINPPGAIGTAESIYAYLLLTTGITQGAMVCLLQRLTYYLWAILGCACYIQRKGKVREAVQASREVEPEEGFETAAGPAPRTMDPASLVRDA